MSVAELLQKAAEAEKRRIALTGFGGAPLKTEGSAISYDSYDEAFDPDYKPPKIVNGILVRRVEDKVQIANSLFTRDQIRELVQVILSEACL